MLTLPPIASQGLLCRQLGPFHLFRPPKGVEVTRKFWLESCRRVSLVRETDERGRETEENAVLNFALQSGQVDILEVLFPMNADLLWEQDVPRQKYVRRRPGKVLRTIESQVMKLLHTFVRDHIREVVSPMTMLRFLLSRHAHYHQRATGISADLPQF